MSWSSDGVWSWGKCMLPPVVFPQLGLSIGESVGVVVPDQHVAFLCTAWPQLRASDTSWPPGTEPGATALIDLSISWPSQASCFRDGWDSKIPSLILRALCRSYRSLEENSAIFGIQPPAPAASHIETNERPYREVLVDVRLFRLSLSRRATSVKLVCDDRGDLLNSISFPMPFWRRLLLRRPVVLGSKIVFDGICVQVEKLGHNLVLSRGTPPQPVLLGPESVFEVVSRRHVKMEKESGAFLQQSDPFCKQPRDPSELKASLPKRSKAVKQVRELLLLPLVYASAFRHLDVRCPTGILLSGPPGVGKTWAVKTVAAELGVELIQLDSGRVSSRLAGEAETQLRDSFRQAKERAQHRRVGVLLFLDELDVLCPKRSSEKNRPPEDSHVSRVVTQLLTLLDGVVGRYDGEIEGRGHVVVVGATNFPDRIDPALRRPGRFDRELELKPPDIDERESILSYCTEDSLMVLGEDVDLRVVAQQSIGFVGADLQAVCREAAMCSFKQHVSASPMLQCPVVDHELSLESGRQNSFVVSMDNFLQAVRCVGASSIRDHPVVSSAALVSPGTGDSCLTRSSLSEQPIWEDVGGLQEAKQRLRQAIEWPLRRHQQMKLLGIQPPRGVLLHGPPGCGKTSLARVVARSASAAFFTISGAQLYSCFVGEAEQELRQVFARARSSVPAVVFLDELDALVTSRESNQGVGRSGHRDQTENRLLATLLVEMDGVETAPGVLVVGATNRLDMLDAALLRPGRFDHVVHVGAPSQAERLSILQVHTRRMPLAPDVRLLVLALLTAPASQDSRRCRIEAEEHSLAHEGKLGLKLQAMPDLDGVKRAFSGADLELLCREAAMHTFRQALRKRQASLQNPTLLARSLSVNMASFLAALRSIPPSLDHIT
eukprot:gb/GEZN01001873.1/.p1 GENE.gb/GEZN01001873.1/~~gb/GEZN01001873.1/.p1  ORF type:complete len:890 (-),score=101.75 gb/GEZN01001873.1/:50-2719(-)